MAEPAAPPTTGVETASQDLLGGDANGDVIFEGHSSPYDAPLVPDTPPPPSKDPVGSTVVSDNATGISMKEISADVETGNTVSLRRDKDASNGQGSAPASSNSGRKCVEKPLPKVLRHLPQTWKRIIWRFLYDGPIATLSKRPIVTPTPLEQAFLVINLLVPTIVMIVFLDTLKEIVVSVAMFHFFGCALLPLVYLFLTPTGRTQREPLWSAIKCYATIQPPKIQLILGTFLMFGGILSVFGTYMFIVTRLSVFPDNVGELAIEYGLDINEIPLIVPFMIWFSFANPFIEEMFWRVFFLNTFGRSRWRKAIESTAYALYHFFVLVRFCPLWVCFIADLFLVVAGAVFVIVLEHCGLITVVMMHAGADIGIMWAFSDLGWDWTHSEPV